MVILLSVAHLTCYTYLTAAHWACWFGTNSGC